MSGPRAERRPARGRGAGDDRRAPAAAGPGHRPKEEAATVVPPGEAAAASPAPGRPGPSPQLPSDLTRIGAAIRLLRRQRGLTLRDVASAAGLSTGFLSQIERGLASPSLLSVYALADALSISARYFLGGENTNYTVFRASDRAQAADGGRQVRVTRLSMEAPQQQINLATLTLPPGYDSGPIAHDGEKLVFVVAGRIEITLGEATFALGPSDSTHFRATLSHRIRNREKAAAAVLCGSNILLGGGLS